MLMEAIQPKKNPDWKNKGLPAIIQPDRGNTFLAHTVMASLAFLGIALDPDPPYYPNRKGKIERWFLTLDRGCLRILPGHMSAIGKTRAAAEKHVDVLLTIPQLRAEIERWIIYDYHHHTCTSTRRKPVELWEETVRMRMPESEDAMNLMLLKSEERTVGNTGISFRFPNTPPDADHLYWAPELTYSIRKRVRLRYNPEDTNSVMVYDAATDQYICEAWLMGQADSLYTAVDVSQARNDFRKGLQERIKDYMADIQRLDRKRNGAAGWDEARTVAENEAGEDLQRAADAQTQADNLLEALIDEFNNQDERGSSREVA
jgi:putative transposase